MFSEHYSNTKALADQIPEQTTIAAISRNIVGAFDYGTTLLSPYALPQSPRHTTDAHELALTVVHQSGFNGFADTPEAYLTQLPEVRELLGTSRSPGTRHASWPPPPGSHGVVARRKDSTWYIAGANGKTLTLAPGLDSSAPDCTPPTRPGPAAGLRPPGPGHPDPCHAPALRRLLRHRPSPAPGDSARPEVHGRHRPFGGFIAVL
ncbi:glycoside hydrolase family 97 catalytic domain-containing protein [Streptomyces sp. NPDC019531]|uniref:glycoside hydrolase family 97 catalytic domain-containing protein n=1 Tax=Streptomyces sp. NPDC019531 TaxID=3365062 RepID=UPI00384DF825